LCLAESEIEMSAPLRQRTDFAPLLSGSVIDDVVERIPTSGARSERSVSQRKAPDAPPRPGAAFLAAAASAGTIDLSGTDPVTDSSRPACCRWFPAISRLSPGSVSTSSERGRGES
jgi:hypothetical protein